MIKKCVQKQIDATIKDIWNKNIPKDFEEGYIINEDCLKMSLCYHLRRKLASVLRENNLRIYTEKYFSGMKKKPDIIIAEITDEYEENTLYDSFGSGRGCCSITGTEILERYCKKYFGLDEGRFAEIEGVCAEK